MSAEKISSELLNPGMRVRVNPQSDKSRTVLIDGVIAEILTKSHTHPHGILVLLTSGEKGRVKELISHHDTENTFSGIEQLETIGKIIENGEDHFSEFKTSALWSLRLSDDDIKRSTSREVKVYGRQASKIILAKTISGFLNSDGGCLVLGVKENKEGGGDKIVGIESEYYKIKDKCEDGYRRMLIDGVIKPYFPSSIFNHIHDYIDIRFEKIDSKVVCGIFINKSDIKVFLRINKQDDFYIRVDASTRQIHGEQVVDYCTKRFNN